MPPAPRPLVVVCYKVAIYSRLRVLVSAPVSQGPAPAPAPSVKADDSWDTTEATRGSAARETRA